jgi:enamine deaminase RidA (YjgF/YER057c/UK114 family)
LLKETAVATKIRFLNPDTLTKPPTYSQVVEVTGPGRMIFIAGQIGVGSDGELVGAPGDFRAQAVQVFENLQAALAAVGAGFEHVVKLNNYLVDMVQQPVLREVRKSYLNMSAPPASTSVQIVRLAREAALLEIEAVAVVPE